MAELQLESGELFAQVGASIFMVFKWSSLLGVQGPVIIATVQHQAIRRLKNTCLETLIKKYLFKFIVVIVSFLLGYTS